MAALSPKATKTTKVLGRKEGWMSKAGAEKFSAMKKRYFVLWEDCLLYYVAQTDSLKAPTGAQGVIPLCHSTVVNPDSKAWHFTITPNTDKGCRTYMIAANDEQDRDTWIAAIKALLPSLPASLPPEGQVVGDSLKEGWTLKGGKELTSSLRRRYVVLLKDRLLYFKVKAAAQRGAPAARGVIGLCASSVVNIDHRQEHSLYIIGMEGGREFRFKLVDDTERDAWIVAVQGACAQLGPTIAVSAVSLSAAQSASVAAAEAKAEGRAFASSVYEGTMVKSGGRENKSRKSRYFVLFPDRLLYFKSVSSAVHGEEAALGSIQLCNETILSMTLFPEHTFTLTPVKALDARTYILTPESEHERTMWMTHLTRAITKLPSASEIRARAQDRVDKLSEREGWLWKLGEVNKLQEKKRFFVLHKDRLLYYKSVSLAQKGPSNSQGFISLFGKAVVVADEHRSHGILVTPYESGRTYHLVATDDTDRDHWIDAITKLLPKLPSAPDLEENKDETELKATATPNSNVDPRSLKEGWLLKEGLQIKSWKRRYFVLLPDGIVLYFKSRAAAATGSTKFQGSITLFSDSLATKELKPHVFSLVASVGGRKFLLQGTDDADRDNWISTLTTILPQLSSSQDKIKNAPTISIFERPSDADLINK